MELCPPFEGWFLDEEGIIHTPSGYKTTPLSIEGALWMRELYANDGRDRRLMMSDNYNVVRVWGVDDFNKENKERLAAIARASRPPNCKRWHSMARPTPYPHLSTRLAALRRLSKDGRIIVRTRRN